MNDKHDCEITDLGGASPVRVGRDKKDGAKACEVVLFGLLTCRGCDLGRTGRRAEKLATLTLFYTVGL